MPQSNEIREQLDTCDRCGKPITLAMQHPTSTHLGRVGVLVDETCKSCVGLMNFWMAHVRDFFTSSGQPLSDVKFSKGSALPPQALRDGVQ